MQLSSNSRPTPAARPRKAPPASHDTSAAETPPTPATTDPLDEALTPVETPPAAEAMSGTLTLTVTGRHTTISPAYHTHTLAKLERLRKLDSHVLRVELELRVERNPRQSGTHDCVELAWHSPREVVRSEGCGPNAYSAFEEALDRLTRRLRASHDNKVIHHGRHTPESVRHVDPALLAVAAEAEPVDVLDDSEYHEPDGHWRSPEALGA